MESGPVLLPFFHILRFYLRQKRLLLAAFFLTLIQCTAHLYMPILMAEVVDRGVLEGNLAVISRTGWKMAAACLILVLAGYLSNIFCEIAGERLAHRLRMEVYEKIHTMTLSEAAGFGADSLVTRLTEDIRVCAGFAAVLFQTLLVPVLLAVGGTAVMWRIAPGVGLIFSGFIIFQILLMLLFIRGTTPVFQKLRLLTDRFNRKLQDVLQRLDLIRLRNMQKTETDRFDSLSGEWTQAAMTARKMLAFFQPAAMLAVDLCVGALLLYMGGYARGFQIGNILEALSYTQQILLAIVVSGRMFQFLAQARPSAQRVDAVLEHRSAMSDGTGDVEKKFEGLEARDVSFSWPHSEAGIRDLSLRIEPGAFLVVTGPVGCGKSTLAALLARLEDPGRGQILLNGQPVSAYRLEQLHRHIALVEKSPAVFAGSFRENLIFGREGIDETQIRTALESAQCARLIDSLPDRLDTEAAYASRMISGGENQRLAIARALAGCPDVLLLDDCTASLDLVTEAALLKQIRSNYPAMAVVLFTQRAFTAAQADRVVYMEDGRILKTGTYPQLKSTCPEFCRMLAV